MAYSKAQKKASRKYNETNYDRIGLYLPKEGGKKEIWQSAAKNMDISLSELIIKAVDEYLLQNQT